MPWTGDQVLTLARTHLNDDTASIWPDWRLIPKLQAAQLELFGEIYKITGQATMGSTGFLSIPASPTDGTSVTLNAISGFPTSFISPIYLREKLSSEPFTSYVPMTQVDFLPIMAKGPLSRFWSWDQGLIAVPGGIGTTNIIFRYLAKLTPITYITDDVVVDGAENFLAYRTAALALSSVNGADKQKIQELKDGAERDKDAYITVQIRQKQNMPMRQRGYQSARRRLGNSWR